MNILLDTHILIWALTADERLSDQAKKILLNENNIIYYSSVSIWEVAIKHALRPDNIEFTGKELMLYCREADFLPLDMKDQHVCALETIRRSAGAPPHNDPFDRILIAQAKAERMSFLTHDRLLAHYEERCITIV